MSPNTLKTRHAIQLLLLFFLLAASCVFAGPEEYFCIEVVDEATGRGVPLVRLETTDKSVYYTDSNGLIAFNEPGLMGEQVWFGVSSYGYEFPHESFGARGTALKVIAGGKAQLKIRRINIAQRLYRITGRGIYRDTILLGKKPPIENGALNSQVVGQDSVLTAILDGKLYWFWGDTNRPSHPLGNYFTTGATSLLPDKGGLDPSVGVNLSYFTNSKTGFVHPMVPLNRPGAFPVWIGGVVTVRNEKGEPVIFARYSRVKDMKPFESGMLVFNTSLSHFEELKQMPPSARLEPTGHPLHVSQGGEEYIYFTAPYPCVRVKNEWTSVTDLAAYEGFTCLKDGAAYSKKNPPLDRDAEGKLVWKWRKDTPALKPEELEELISSNAVKRDESPFRLRNADNKKPVQLHHSSVYWNEYRMKWVMIGVQSGGDSFLGEDNIISGSELF